MPTRPNLDGIYGITASPVRAVFMQGLIWRMAQDRFVAAPDMRGLDMLEIGSWCGSSTLTWGEAIDLYFSARGRITCVDAWECFFDTEANPEELVGLMEDALARGEIYEMFCANMRFLPAGVALETHHGRSESVLPGLPKGSFDLVYIDGDHIYDAVAADIANAIPLVRDGGVICGDDLELQAHECDLSIVEQEPKRQFAHDARNGVPFHPGVTKAVGERFGPVSSWHGFWAMKRVANRWVPISLDGMPLRIPSHIPPARLAELKLFLMRAGAL